MYRSRNERDWNCPKCGYKNFGRNKKCRQCSSSPSGAGARAGARGRAGASNRTGAKAGDWTCPSCNGHNFANKRQCWTCKRPKPAPAQAAPYRPSLAPRANESNSKNDSTKSGDAEDHKQKPESGSASSNARTGNGGGASGSGSISGVGGNDRNGWKCGNCLNFHQSDSLLCRVCNIININCHLMEASNCFHTRFITGTLRKGGSARKGQDAMAASDWECQDCGTKNRPSRFKCFNRNCNARRPQPKVQKSLQGTNEQEKANPKDKQIGGGDGSGDGKGAEDVDFDMNAKSKASSNDVEKEESKKRIDFAKGCLAILTDGGEIDAISLDADNTTFAIKVSWNIGKLSGFGTALFENETSAVLAQQILGNPTEYRIPEAHNLPVFNFDFRNKNQRYNANRQYNDNYIEKDDRNESIFKLKLKLPQNMVTEDKLDDALLTIEIAKILEKGIKQQRNEPLVKCQFIEAKVFRQSGGGGSSAYGDGGRRSGYSRGGRMARLGAMFGGSNGSAEDPKQYNLSVLKAIFDKYNCEKIRVNDAKFGVCSAILSFGSIDDAMNVMQDCKSNALGKPPAKFCYSRKLNVQFDLRCVLDVASPFVYSCLKAEIERLMYTIRRNKLQFGNTKIFLFQFESRVVICGNDHEPILLACKLYHDLIEPSIIKFDNEIVAHLVFDRYLKQKFQEMHSCVIQGPSHGVNEEKQDEKESKNESSSGSFGKKNEIRIYSTKEQRGMIEEAIKYFQENNIERQVLKGVSPQFIRLLASPKYGAVLKDWKKNGVFVRCDISSKTIELYHLRDEESGNAKDDEAGSSELKKYCSKLEALSKEVKSEANSNDEDISMTKNKEDEVICGVCFMGFEENEMVMKLTNCDHCVHKDCFELQMQASAQPGGARPIKCAQCAMLISLTDICNALDNESKLENIFQLSISDYVDTHPNLFGYCPTPDCRAIYEKRGRSPKANANANESSNSNGGSEEKEEKKSDDSSCDTSIYSCQECLRQYCLTCVKDGTPVSYHFGLTCEEYKPLINEDASFAAFMTQYSKDKDTKNCPNCNTITDKFKHTCNHATCVYCQTHFCWKCLWFDKSKPNSGTVIYSHMTEKHGNWYR